MLEFEVSGLGLHANVASELKKIVYALEWRRVGAPTLRYSKTLLNSALFKSITQLCNIPKHYSTLH